MTRLSLTICLLAVFALLTSPAPSQTTGTKNMTTIESALLQPWTGPYDGVPPWNLVRADEFTAAFESAIATATGEIEAIANNSEPATFDNTIVALEKAGQSLDRLSAIFGVHCGNLNIGPMPDIQKIVKPQQAAYYDSITQNEKLFARIEAVYNSDEMKTRSVAEQRLVDDKYKDFVRGGARLNETDKERLSKINQRLASLFADFSQHVLNDEDELVTWIEDESRLGGLSDSQISALANTAKEKSKNDGKEGKWAVANTRSAMDPFLTYAEDRELREQVWRTYYSRGGNGDKNDNTGIIVEILQLRARRAKLLGYETHAHWRLEPSMAKTPEATMELMMSIWPKAVARVREEVADMQQIADAEGADLTIEPWDYRYYAEKVRADKYDLDLNEVKPYMQLDKMVEAMLWCSSELFGLKYTPVNDVPVFHPDVRVWNVTRSDAKDGSKEESVGLFYLDPYARTGKLSGAWMTRYRPQQNIGERVMPLISNNSNFIKPAAGEPSLISWDDAETLFHEFGHGLHGLLSNVQYPSQSGTSVYRDYVEFPSQIYEHWLGTPEVLSKFCVHHETGEPMPKELAEKIEKAATFNQGFGTVEFLASALYDMKVHLAGDAEIDPIAFEKKILDELGMPKEIVMRHRTPHFAHIFSSDGYSAGYYSYLWADALTADAAEAFEQAGGFFDEKVAKELHDKVLSVGDTIDPADGFRAFRGRDVDPQALLRKRGFPVD